MSIMNKRRSIMLKIFQQTESWIAFGVLVLFIYTAARVLFFGIDYTVYLILSFLSSVLFFVFINVIYGCLPPYAPSVHASNDWKKWLRYGWGGIEKAPFGNSIGSRKSAFYLFIIAFIGIDILNPADFLYETMQDYIKVYVLCVIVFLFSGLAVRNIGSAKHWMENEIYWIKCVWTFLLCSVLICVFFLTFNTEKYANALLFLALLYPLIYMLHNLVLRKR